MTQEERERDWKRRGRGRLRRHEERGAAEGGGGTQRRTSKLATGRR
ncbi:hypothetical protein A2U01_0109257, partial [Trifolium medium]|nr:hypothetical protein [Trifolium medium]